jgi:hypothetical protein
VGVVAIRRVCRIRASCQLVRAEFLARHAPYRHFIGCQVVAAVSVRRPVAAPHSLIAGSVRVRITRVGTGIRHDAIFNVVDVAAPAVITAAADVSIRIGAVPGLPVGACAIDDVIRGRRTCDHVLVGEIAESVIRVSLAPGIVGRLRAGQPVQHVISINDLLAADVVVCDVILPLLCVADRGCSRKNFQIVPSVTDFPISRFPDFPVTDFPTFCHRFPISSFHGLFVVRELHFNNCLLDGRGCGQCADQPTGSERHQQVVSTFKIGNVETILIG